MSTFHHHRVFGSGEPYRQTIFNDLAELLSVDSLLKHQESKGFLRFCMKDSTLMAVYKDRFIIAGHIDGEVDIPTMCQLCKLKQLPVRICAIPVRICANV